VRFGPPRQILRPKRLSAFRATTDVTRARSKRRIDPKRFSHHLFSPKQTIHFHTELYLPFSADVPKSAALQSGRDAIGSTQGLQGKVINSAPARAQSCDHFAKVAGFSQPTHVFDNESSWNPHTMKTTYYRLRRVDRAPV
jgi:hypothetical protein